MSAVRGWNADAYHRVSGPQVAMSEAVIDRLELRGDETVLDAGCGSGRVTAMLIERLPEGRLVGIDGSTSMVAMAREALEDYGFKAVVAASFADIFFNNCTKIGLLPVVLPEEDVRALMAAGSAEVDLEALEVRFDGRAVPFELDDETRHRLLNGLDDIALTLQQGDAIDAYERDRERSGPVTTPV